MSIALRVAPLIFVAAVLQVGAVAGSRVLGVRVDGRRRPYDRETATVDLSGLRGTLSIVAAVR